MGIFLAILFDFSCNCELETNWKKSQFTDLKSELQHINLQFSEIVVIVRCKLTVGTVRFKVKMLIFKAKNQHLKSELWDVKNN